MLEMINFVLPISASMASSSRRESYSDSADDGCLENVTTCECRLAAESTAHMLQCSLLAHLCTLDDLLEFNDTVQACTERWKKIV